MPIDPQIKILLVEDSKITRKMEFKALKDVGFDNVLQAGDGDEAIEILQSEEDIRLINQRLEHARKGRLRTAGLGPG